MLMKPSRSEVTSMDCDLDFHQRIDLNNMLYNKSTDFYRDHSHIKKTIKGEQLRTPKKCLMGLFLPYVLHSCDDMGILRLVNRAYKPFGLGDRHDFVEYTDPRWQKYRYTQELTYKEVASIVDCYPKEWNETQSRIKRFRQQDGYIAFYGDGCPPWRGESYFKSYMKRLEAFCALISNGKIERIQ